MGLGQFPGQLKGICGPKMVILPLKYVQITHCRVLPCQLRRSVSPQAINMKKYVVYLPLKIVWHICERPPCEKIIIYSRRCNKTCTAHIQNLKKKKYFLPFL